MTTFQSSPFKRRLVEGCGPMYHHGKPLKEYSEYGWLSQMDLETYPYLDREEMEKAVRRFGEFARKVSSLGFNGMVLGESLHLVTLERLKIYGDDSPFRLRAEEFSRYYRKMLAAAATLDLSWYVYSDEYIYNEEIEKWMGAPCFENPRLWEYYQERYRELLTKYPEVSGIMIRYGELREYCGYKGLSFKRPLCSCRKCMELDQEARLRMLVEKTQQVVNGEFSKEVIFRTWRPCLGNIHNDPDLYVKAFDGLEPKGLVLSMKDTMSDFWFYQPFNPNFGAGKISQMAEFDWSRDYEGRGLFPCVTADWWSRSFRNVRDKGVDSVWVWLNESGNPNGVNGQPLLFTYFKGFTKWVEANIFLCSRLALNPDENPSDILKDWVSVEFGPEASEEIVKILLASEEAARKAFYIRDYAKENIWLSCLPARQARILSKHPTPSFPDVSKEDHGHPERMLPNIYRACRNDLEGNIREGYEALEQADRDLTLFEGLKEKVRDRDLYENALHSFQHRSLLFLCLARYREFFLHFFAERESGGSAKSGRVDLLAQKLEKSIREYEDSFNIYDFSQVKDFVVQNRKP